MQNDRRRLTTSPEIAEIGRLNEVVNNQRDFVHPDGAPPVQGDMVLITLTRSV
ncbi:MAG: hypothetical protein IPK19_18805 [Chloroflexi bacterium]|nr:hypothetical protein [Chloroflexota bacterium]